MSSAELTEWCAYERLEPFPIFRLERYFAHLTSLIANVNRDTKAKPEPFTLEDFLMDFTGERAARQETEAADPERLERFMETIRDMNRAMGGREIRRS